MKRFLSGLLCFLMCILLYEVQVGAEILSPELSSPREYSLERELLRQLRALDLFQEPETGELEDTYLSRKLEREEALAVLLRLNGYNWKEVSANQNTLLSAMGYSPGKTSASMYLKFMLRALGYADGENEDFASHSPWALAAQCGILPPQVNRMDFTLADAVTITAATLFAKYKDSDQTLYERLSAKGLFTKEQFRKVFPIDPLASYRLIDRRVANAILSYQPKQEEEKNRHWTQAHIITDLLYEDGVYTVSALVCEYTSVLGEGNAVLMSGSNTELWQITLDDDQILSCQTTTDLLQAMQDDFSLYDYFSSRTLEDQYILSEGLDRICSSQMQRELESGRLQYIPPSYEEALAEVTQSLSEVTQTIETPICTILLGYLGGVPHGPHTFLYVIYKRDSPLGEGKTLSLPLPFFNAWSTTTEPDELTLSEDGLTLYYSYYFPEPVVTDDGLVHQAGTYSYNVDLMTGEDDLEILD